MEPVELERVCMARAERTVAIGDGTVFDGRTEFDGELDRAAVAAAVVDFGFGFGVGGRVGHFQAKGW